MLWFGGVYPWFDIGCLLEAVKALSEKHAVGLVIVGAKNPFVNHPDFEQSYERMMKMIEDPAIRPLVHLVDWVPFHERGNWYLDADLICFANQPGMENLLAWRTRVVDYLWTRTPLATNGGDPLSEEMIAAGAAVRIDATDPAAARCHTRCDPRQCCETGGHAAGGRRDSGKVSVAKRHSSPGRRGSRQAGGVRRVACP